MTTIKYRGILFSATYARDVFKIRGISTSQTSQTSRPEVTIDATSISCMLPSVPEVILMYVIAQMMKISRAGDVDGCDKLIAKADKHIQRKIALFTHLAATTPGQQNV